MWNVKCQPRKGKWILSNRHEKRLACSDGKDKRAPVVTAAVVARPETRPHRQLGKNEPQAFCAHCNEWIPMEWRPSKERGKTAETWFQCEYCGGRDLTLRYLSPGEAVRRNALRCKPSPPRDSICMANVQRLASSRDSGRWNAIGAEPTQGHHPRAEVNHKNGNKQDSSLANLEWVTRSQNELHSYRVLGKKRNNGKTILK